MHEHLVEVRPRTRHRRVRVGIATLLGATCLGVVALPVAAANAAPITQSVSPQRVAAGDPLSAVANTALAQLRTYVRSGDGASLAQYKTTRDGIAGEVGNRLGVDPARLQAAWDRADVPHQMALIAAFTQLGVPYRHNQSKPGVGFDCSGLTSFAWGTAGVRITRQSSSQIRNAAKRTIDTAQAGDLVYYPGHAMLYLGVDYAIVHAPNSGRNVEVDTLGRRRSVRFGNPLG